MADFNDILNYSLGDFEGLANFWGVDLGPNSRYLISRDSTKRASGSASGKFEGRHNGTSWFPFAISGSSGKNTPIVFSQSGLESRFLVDSVNIDSVPTRLNFVKLKFGVIAPNVIDENKWKVRFVEQTTLGNASTSNITVESPNFERFISSAKISGTTGIFTAEIEGYSRFGGRVGLFLEHSDPISDADFEAQTEDLIIWIDDVQQSGEIEFLQANEVLTNPNNTDGNNGEIQLNVTGGPDNSIYTYQWSNGATTNTISGLEEGNYTVTIRVQDTGMRLTKTFRLDFTPLEPLQVNGTVENVTVGGANDGSITLIVTGGSGDYSYQWDTGQTTQSLINIGGGVYNVTVTDNQTGQDGTGQFTVIEPGVQEPELGFFEIPKMQSITFARGLDRSQIEDGNYWDLALHYQQKERLTTFGHGFCYLQKFRQIDKVPLQIRSEVATINVELYDSNNEFVRSFLPQRKTEYFNQILDFSVLLQNNGGGTTRVYFQGQQTIPVQLEPGESTIEIINSVATSLNGNYLVLLVEFDLLQNQQYLVVNHNYTESLNAYAATGLVPFSRVPFDIYESIIDFQTVNEGEYYIKAYLAGFEADSVYYSEPILIQERHDNTVKIEFSNFDNANDIDYTTGFSSIVRPDCIMFKRLPSTENTTIRNTDNSLEILRSRPKRQFEMQLISLPPYLIEKLSLALVQDVLKIQGVEFKCPEGLAEGDYVDRFGLASAVAIVEQKDWFGTFNSDDIGGIESDENLIIANTGFIKR